MASASLQQPQTIIQELWEAYNEKCPTQLKIIDAYLAYVISTGIIQFLYCCLVGTFPFNAFLGGFISSVGCAALTISLRMQINPENRKDPRNGWKKLVPARAYADWLFCNLILHMAVLNFLG